MKRLTIFWIAMAMGISLSSNYLRANNHKALTHNTETSITEDYRHNMCQFYKTRVEEARAGRKDDVALNRQIDRDLKQIDYYCR
jgi:hypothetical protein